jgi:phenylacetic acid degradation protein paaN
LNKRSFEIANAVMHTTGQAFMMAFQAGGPHAQDRGLEAVAYAHAAMTQCPAVVTWSKQVSKTETVSLEKRYRIVPRGVAVVIGCSTFPTWNGYPGMFASLATGNAVVVKPHPGATLPLAITVEIARDVLREVGFDPNVVTLLADDPEAPVAKALVAHGSVRIVDYTGGSAFGEWIEENARQAEVYTEKAGVNSIVIDSAADMKAVSGNIAFSLSLYSGQMCTTPQNIFIPKGGVEVGGERKRFDEVAGAIVKALDWLLGDEARAVEILGAIQNEDTVKRIGLAKSGGGDVIRESRKLVHPHFPDARVHTPLVMKVSAADRDVYMKEMFGPIAYVVATENTEESIALAAATAREVGSITCAAYSTDDGVLEKVEAATSRAGVPLSCNLTGSIWVNQSAAFSDFHVSGVNPSGNATLCDAAYVANRFRIVQSRVLVPG